jgi:uncharacterized protein YrzB (UPF0473 family)
MASPNDDLTPEEEEGLFVTLTDDDGEEQTFQLVQTVELNGNSYGVLVAEYDEEEVTEPSEDEEDDEGEIVILRIVKEDGEEYFEEIEDEAEFQKVIDHLESLAKEAEVNLGGTTTYN